MAVANDCVGLDSLGVVVRLGRWVMVVDVTTTKGFSGLCAVASIGTVLVCGGMDTATPMIAQVVRVWGGFGGAIVVVGGCFVVVHDSIGCGRRSVVLGRIGRLRVVDGRIRLGCYSVWCGSSMGSLLGVVVIGVRTGRF